MRRMKSHVKWKSVLLVALILFTACNQLDRFSSRVIKISGELQGAENAVILLSELDVKTVSPIDSMRIGKDGKFSFKFKAEGSSFYMLKLSPVQKLILVADSGDIIHITGNAANLAGTARIEGSPSSALLLGFDRFTSLNQAQADSLSRLFMSSRSDPGFAGIREHLDSTYAGIVSRQKLYMEKFIEKYPASLASLLLLNHRFGPNFIFTEKNDARYFIKVDSGLMTKYQGNKHAIDHHNRVTAMIKKHDQLIARDNLLLPGKAAPDLRLSNVEGEPVSLSSLKGKVVLVYFWAAMDGESRRFIRKLIPIYKANRNRGFEIFGVAREPNKTLWLNALKLDRPGGIQVTEDGRSGSPVADLFGIDSLPEAILLDRQGKILVRRITPEELRRKLPVQLQLK